MNDNFAALLNNNQALLRQQKITYPQQVTRSSHSIECSPTNLAACSHGNGNVASSDNPTDVHDFPWIYENSKQNGDADGKWMLFYSHEILDEKWRKIRDLYREGHLTGVNSLKCSTSYRNPRASGTDGVIICYCCNSTDESYIIAIGRRLMTLMLYNDTMFYKTNVQTRFGTRATGIQKNYTYRLDPIIPLLI